MKKKSTQKFKKITQLRSLFPKQINVRVHQSKNGKFCAEIITYPDCFTEADTFSSLIEMVNDAVRTYYEVPKKYFPYVPNYMPPLKLAQKFNIFPIREKTGELKFEIINQGAKS
jgi:predicted RNase H-like HicB family nuclease